MIKYCFIDCDPPAYRGATSKEKVRYRWVRGDEKSKLYSSAKDAEDFIITQEMMEDDEGWDRESIKDIPLLKDVQDASVTCLKEYMEEAIRLTNNKDLIFIGYMTASGIKSKDINGLENMYQHNRDGLSKPLYLEEAKNHLLNTFDFIKMCPAGYEADAILMARTENKGLEGVIMFIDKDLRGVEGCHYIDMNPKKKDRELVLSPKDHGLLYLKKKNKNSSKEVVKGHGFIWEIFQAVAGDTADGYKGLKNYGEKKVYNLLKDCKSKKEVIKTALALYEKVHPDGLTYIPEKYPEDRPQKEQFRTAKDLLEQHINLAHQERKPKDYFKVSDYLD